MVQEGALTALASVADSSQVILQTILVQWIVSYGYLNLILWNLQEHFQKYYDAVMSYLKTILLNATDKSNHMLCAKSMECISLVGTAVEKG